MRTPVTWDQLEANVKELDRRQAEISYRAFDRTATTPTDTMVLAELKDRFDESYKALGASRGAPHPLAQDSAYTYRRRLAAGLQPHSTRWKDINVWDLDAQALAPVEQQIIQDVHTAAADLTRGNPDGTLRAIHSVSPGGHPMVTYAGSPKSWLSQFAGRGQAVKSFRWPNGTPMRIQRRSI